MFHVGDADFVHHCIPPLDQVDQPDLCRPKLSISIFPLVVWNRHLALCANILRLQGTDIDNENDSVDRAVLDGSDESKRECLRDRIQPGV